MTGPRERPNSGTPLLGLDRARRRLGLELIEVAAAAGLDGTQAYLLSSHGRWPDDMDDQARARAQQAITDLLASHGATPSELAGLFAQRVRSRKAFPPGPDRAATHPEPLAAPDLAADRAPGAQTQEPNVLIAKQVLQPTAARHFQLFRNPFDGAVERDEQLFVSDEIAYHRELLWQCAIGGGFMALVGESGAGKTTLLNDLEDRLSRKARGVVLIKPSTVGMEEKTSSGHMLRSADLLHAVITTLDSSAGMPASLQARTALALRLLAASARAGNAHLLAVEEAHRMPEPTLRHLKRLHELREGRRPLLGILLLGQPELQRRLSDGLRSGTLREVAQRCEVVALPPLDKDLQGYLECRAKASGPSLAKIIDAGAVPAIADKLTATVGQERVPMSYPLAVNNLVTRAMNLAAHIGAPLVTAEVVREV